MSAYYFDSSAIVKRYVKETGSAWVVAITDPTSGNEIFTSLISGAEVVAAICRSGRMGTITPQAVTQALTAFKSEFRSQFTILQLSDSIIDQAMALAEKHGLRGYDSVQLATSTGLHAERSMANLSPLVFVSGDNKLNAAAQVEGLLVENPNHHP
jgi:predicted nucleic acid-binding protein